MSKLLTAAAAGVPAAPPAPICRVPEPIVEPPLNVFEPRYLELVGEAWLECRRARPALPFGGRAAARETEVVSARLLLADAARAVLAAGLGLTGIQAASRM